MGLFSRKPRLTHVNQHLLQQAEALVSSARALAVSGYMVAAEREPIVSKLRPNDWDFFLTVAGVFIAASALNQWGVSEAVEESLMEIISRDLDEWNGDATRGFEDCKALFERTYDRLAGLPAYQHDQRFLASDAVGYWIAWNLLGHAPAQDDEIKLMRIAGTGTWPSRSKPSQSSSEREWPTRRPRNRQRSQKRGVTRNDRSDHPRML